MINITRAPRLLYSYLATEMLAPFFASFVVMNGVFFLVKLIPFLNVVLDLEINFADFLRLFCYLFPNMFLYSIPMAAMMGVIISFTRLSADGEILAFKAGGISLYSMLPPVIAIAFTIAVITGYFSVNLIPKSELAMKQLMFQVAKEKIDKGIKENQFTEALGDLVVYVDSIDKESGEWENVWVSDMRGQIHPVITMAQSGTMVANLHQMMVVINLQNGSLHRPDRNHSQIITFDHYTINIPLQTPTVLDGDDVTQLSVSAMDLRQLQESADILGRHTAQGIDRLIHFHKRLTLPVGCFILSLLGMPLGLLAGPGKKAIGIPIGLGFFIFYYILFTTGKTMAEDATLPVFWAMWLPNSVFLAITIYMIRQATLERPVTPPVIKNILSIINDKYISPLFMAIRGIRYKSKKSSTSDLIISDTTEPDSLSDFLTAGMIHGNINTRTFHLPECDFYSCKDCTIEFKDVKLALEAGFKPCDYCDTLLSKQQ